MVKVKLEMVLNNSWDGYCENDINEDILLSDILTTLQDQKLVQEEVVSVTIKSKHII